jgi:hypothetical protein
VSEPAPLSTQQAAATTTGGPLALLDASPDTLMMATNEGARAFLAPSVSFSLQQFVGKRAGPTSLAAARPSSASHVAPTAGSVAPGLFVSENNDSNSGSSNNGSHGKQGGIDPDSRHALLMRGVAATGGDLGLGVGIELPSPDAR